MIPSSDQRVRLAAFEWLQEQVDLHGDVLPWTLLLKGFEFEGERVPLVSQQGIFKPKVLREIPLSIRTSSKGPYTDAFRPDGLLRYAYRGVNRDHPENRGLRLAMTGRVPLVYFHSVLPGKYLATWPVYIVGDNPGSLEFTVAIDDATQLMSIASHVADSHAGADARREYVTRTFRARLHQRIFSERVLAAYRGQCALCRLRHRELLDAAHIDPDSSPEGEPLVSNGFALCKLHHAAFDRYFLTVRPDHVIEVRQSILDEEDGPMLLHGLKELHRSKIDVPTHRKDWPDPERLGRRWAKFQEVQRAR